MAEGEGFEPSMGFNTHNGLANRRLQPLGHPSAKRAAVNHDVCGQATSRLSRRGCQRQDAASIARKKKSCVKAERAAEADLSLGPLHGCCQSAVELHTQEPGSALAVKIVRQLAVVITGMLDRANQVHTGCEGVARTEVVDLDLAIQGVVTLLPGHAEAWPEGEA